MTDWSKIGKSSRRRGCEFERMVAKRLTVLLGERTHKFLRTPMSGGHGIDGDVYEDHNYKTEWSNMSIYCRTIEDISWEGMLNGEKTGAIKWIEETGINSMWIFRTKPSRVFIIMFRDRLIDFPSVYPIIKLKNWIMFNLEKLPFTKLNLDKYNVNTIEM